MSNLSLTFNTPTINIFMPDDYSYMTDGSATLSIDIRNTETNYLIYKKMYQVVDRYGNYPNNYQGLYYKSAQETSARTANTRLGNNVILVEKIPLHEYGS